MSYIQTLETLGQEVRAARLAAGLTTVEVARDSGRSRDVLHRLENGRDVSVSSLLAILAAMQRRIGLAALARPTLGDMQRRFAHLQEQDAPALPAAAPAPAKRVRGR